MPCVRGLGVYGRVLAIVLALTALVLPAAASPIADLQQALNDAGYSTGRPDGQWGKRTTKALTDFAADHGLTIPTPTGMPGDADALAALTHVEAWLSEDLASYPSRTMPSGYTFGIGNEWFRNIHSWENAGVATVDGQLTGVISKRSGQLLPMDIAAFQSAGVRLMRTQINWEGIVFWKECQGGVQRSYEEADDCYAAAFEASSKNGWQQQTEALEKFEYNNGVVAYMEAVESLVAAGFHVIVAPNDFYWGGGNWIDAKHDPLLHRYLERDAGLRTFYVKWVAALATELRRRGIADVSIQSLNEPRYCPGGRPTAKSLADWTALDADILSGIRRVAPNMHLITSAACVAVDQLVMDGDISYADALTRTMPRHDLTNISYAVHIRTPRILFHAYNEPIKKGVEIAYPFVELPRSAIAKGHESEVIAYNRLKPSPEYFDRVFAEIAEFGRANNLSIMVSEWDVPRPEYNVTRESRLALMRDFSQSARDHGVPTIYSSIFERPGLSSCPVHAFLVDHRFDPAIMRLIAQMNDHPSVSAETSLPPLDETCGPSVTLATFEQLSNKPGNSISVDSLMMTEDRTTPDYRSYNYILRGIYAPKERNFLRLKLVVQDPPLASAPSKALQACEGDEYAEDWGDSGYRLVLPFEMDGTTVRPVGLDCRLEAVPEDVAAVLRFVAFNFETIAKDMAASGMTNAVANEPLKQWLNDVAAGTVTIEGAK